MVRANYTQEHDVAVRAALAGSVAGISDRDMEVLRLRLDGWSLRAIAEKFGVTSERIRQLEHRGVFRARRRWQGGNRAQ